MLNDTNPEQAIERPVTHDSIAAWGDRVVPFTPREPKQVHLTTYWELEHPVTRKTIKCVGYEATFGLKMRVESSDEVVIDEKRFREPEAKARMDRYAAMTRIALVALLNLGHLCRS
jgi:hypothetical protein